MPEILIRPADVADAAALARLHVACWRGAYRGIMPGFMLDGLSVDPFAAHWGRALAAPEARLTHVAEQGERLVGFVASGPYREEGAVRAEVGELYALYLPPERWGEGLGWRLWRTAHEDLLRAGYQEARLWVLKENARARAFYERVGFELEPGQWKSIEREGARLPEVRYHMSLRG